MTYLSGMCRTEVTVFGEPGTESAQLSVGMTARPPYNGLHHMVAASNCAADTFIIIIIGALLAVSPGRAEPCTVAPQMMAVRRRRRRQLVGLLLHSRLLARRVVVVVVPPYVVGRSVGSIASKLRRSG